MTALTVAERVERLRKLDDDERWELLVALDQRSPKNMDTAIEYMRAAFVVRAEIVDDPEPQPAPPTAGETREIGMRIDAACGDREEAREILDFLHGYDPAAMRAAIVHADMRPDTVTDAPPRASDDEELCNDASPPETDPDTTWHCNAPKDHPGSRHVAVAGGLVLRSWPARFQPAPPAGPAAPDGAPRLDDARAAREAGAR